MVIKSPSILNEFIWFGVYINIAEVIRRGRAQRNRGKEQSDLDASPCGAGVVTCCQASARRVVGENPRKRERGRVHNESALLSRMGCNPKRRKGGANDRRSRHCEARSDVAIQAAVQFSGRTKQTERSSGLPRACGPENDEVEGERIRFCVRALLDKVFPPLWLAPVLKNAERVLKGTSKNHENTSKKSVSAET
jgi:hypothetical protein